MLNALVIIAFVSLVLPGLAHGQGGRPSPPPKAPRQATVPVAPSAQRFMWQTLQTDFAKSCTVPIAIAISEQATCYTAADGQMKCAGRIFETTYGPTFVDAGQSGVDQILITPTFSQENGNSLCIHRSNGTAACMGLLNNNGQFGNGTTLSTSTFESWGTASNLRRIGTGTNDQFCAVDTNDDVWCAGLGYGAVPTLVGSGSNFWVSTGGQVNIDDPDVYRVSDGRSVCKIGVNGLSCPEISATFQAIPRTRNAVQGWAGGRFPNLHACWLDSRGVVSCVDSSGNTSSRFTNGIVLALATHAYTESQCAVYNDGSIWCIGPNEQGKLGTGDFANLTTETMVQPAGSISTVCR